MEKKLQELKTRLLEINDLNNAAALLSWDQSTYMPPGGAEARGRQMATLGKLAQEKMVDPAVGKLLDELRPYEEGLPYDSDDASLIRVARRTFEQAVNIPPSFVAEFTNHNALSYQAWTEARPANDFNRVRPMLEKTLDYSRQMAEYFPGYGHIADPLINFTDYGMKASDVSAIFAQLRKELVPIVKAITSQEPADDSCLRQFYPQDKQLEFGLKVIKKYGYDFNRGRQDLTHHPFMTKFSLGDIRITTRVHETDLGDALFSTLHESGHAMYEMGINMAYEGTPLANGTSSGVHESQSRLWENIVGRSRGFWDHFYPDLQATFPDQLGKVSLDTFYRAINGVRKSLIRTDADEVTYNLHVMLRFDLEMQMLDGSLSIRDLPEAWQERYENDLGIAAPDNRDGVLQDVHWYAFTIGGVFQGYTLGNILSGLYYQAALKAHPEIPAEINHGKFDTLHNWLRTNLYQHGSKFTAAELTERVTGGPLRIEPYIQYLKTKYGELYKLD
ncbi:MAG: carboxypeptidase M32 [Chloroflexi bacterium]|nr:carboxypeptidase M32 [Chloroflexota bacterium]MCC6892380.1 carboxypeptidase M32 [Anaerolineae bacterium]